MTLVLQLHELAFYFSNILLNLADDWGLQSNFNIGAGGSSLALIESIGRQIKLNIHILIEQIKVSFLHLDVIISTFGGLGQRSRFLLPSSIQSEVKLLNLLAQELYLLVVLHLTPFQFIFPDLVLGYSQVV